MLFLDSKIPVAYNPTGPVQMLTPLISGFPAASSRMVWMSLSMEASLRYGHRPTWYFRQYCSTVGQAWKMKAVTGGYRRLQVVTGADILD